MDIWQEHHPVHFGAIDGSGGLTIASAFDFFQEAAINHAGDLGVGLDAMAETGQAWVLSRISVQMDRRPRWRENLVVRSWPRGWEKLFALRDYDMRDCEDHPVVRGRSGWLILDMKTRRPLRPQAVMEGLPANEGVDALPGGGQGLVEQPRLISTGERRAAYSDIDYNGHVNNARYIQWIQDITENGILEEAGCIRLDINYLNEVKYGGITELWMAPIDLSASAGKTAFDRAFAFEGRRRDGGGAVFRAELRTGKTAR